MQIDQLLKPIDPPPGGLLKLQQAIRSRSERRSAHSRRWHVAMVVSVGLIWFGSELGRQESPGQSADLTVAAMALKARDASADATPQQSHIVELQSSNTKVKMYWLMADG